MVLKVPAQGGWAESEDVPLVTSDHPVPVVYSDGAAEVDIQDDNVRVTYFEYRTVAGVRVRSPVLEMIRPLRSCGQGALSQMVAAKLGATGQRRNH